MFGLGLQRGVSEQGLRINVREANRSRETPLNSASSVLSTASTLVEIEPFDADHVFISKKPAFLPPAFESNWKLHASARKATLGRRKWALLFLGSVVLGYFLFQTSRKAKFTPLRRTRDCNPFEQRGVLHLNASSVEDNFWQPFQASCRPSLLMNELRSKKPPMSLSWLQDRTVVVIGDSVDRHHVQDFCELAGGKLEWVSSRHGASPAPFRNGRDELLKRSGEHSEKTARPYVCLVERYNFMMLSLYHFGFATPEELGKGWFDQSSEFYAPFRLQDRIRHIAAPILRTYRRQKPDLVSIGSSFFDASQLSAEQSRRKIEQTDLDRDLLGRYGERMGQAILRVMDMEIFSQAHLLWRTAHVPKASARIPVNAVLALDQVAMTVIHDLREDAAAPWWKSAGQSLSPSEHQRIASRLRVDYSGQMLQGQTQHLNDELHPALLPNGKIWSDIILYELKLAVQSKVAVA